MRIVIIGLGIQGKKRMAIAQSEPFASEGEEVVATVDPIVPTARYKTIEEVPLDSYDAALVCTPDSAKFAILTYLLARGKHALVEKPILADNEKEIRELIDLSQKHGATCYTAYNHRFEPHIVRVKELLDRQAIGEIYFARLFYGNGTARDVRNSPWRDKGTGVLPDLGSHLLDLSLFLFGQVKAQFEPWSYNCFENQAFDRFLFGCQGKPALEMEMTLLSWRNSFYLDIYGELGSAHIDCLCKWGPSIFKFRKRVFPSGRPEEEIETIESKDPTWAKEYRYFKELCRTGGTNLENDIWISSVLKGLADAVGKPLII